MSDPLIGQQLGNFRIEHLLGHGGMAQVYYGWDVQLHRPVAIKVIDARYRDDPAYARRIVKEARVLAKWHHENIIQTYYADNQSGLYFYAMEYIDGQNLATLLSSYAIDGELIPLDDVLHIAKTIAGALDYAHKKGVIHRDVKPSNILIARDGRVVLGDFGLALDLHEGSIGDAFGTPHYISPEQASKSANAVPQSDLYSLGVILYEMLTGVVPFNDQSPTTVALLHITDPPPLPRSINPMLNVEVEAVLLKALAKSPEDRYQTGHELVSALEKTLQSKKTKEKVPFPPLPVGVPTIKRRSISKKSVAEKVTSAPASIKKQKPKAKQNHISSPELKKKKKGKEKRRSCIGWLLFLLFAFAAVIFAFSQGWFEPGAFSSIIPLHLVQGTATQNDQLLPVALTNTLDPANTKLSASQQDFPTTPTMTSTPRPTVVNTLTLSPSPTTVPTSSPTVTVIPELLPSPTTVAVTATPLDGNLFRLYYNENSFYIHNLSDVTRSISGFDFEKLDNQGTIIVTFGGWKWERYYENLSPNRCMAIELYNSLPHLRPLECSEKPYLSILSPTREAAETFWTTQQNSNEFRVLWLGEEIKRCQVGVGTCDLLVP